MFRLFVVCIFCFASFSSGTTEQKFSENALIPRDVLLTKPDKFCVRLSPNGQYISYFSRTEHGIVLHIETIHGKFVQEFQVENCRNMYSYTWCYTNQHILIPEDNDGDENDHIICLNIQNGTKINLTPFGNSKSFVSDMSEDFPNEIIIQNNQRNAKWFDAYKINLTDQKVSLLYKNDEFTELRFDDNLQPKLFVKTLANGDTQFIDSNNKEILLIPFDDIGVSAVYHFKKGTNVLYASLCKGKDKAALVEINTDNSTINVLSESEESNVSIASCDPKTFQPQLASTNYLKAKYIVLSEEIDPCFNFLKEKFADKEFFIQGRSIDDKIWLISTQESDEPVRYYLFIKNKLELRFLFSNQPILEKYHLQKMEPVVIKARDGLNLVCYLTRARNADKKPTPLVAYIHGGPWTRDSYGFDKTVQLLANRGYSVLQINYRGSTGFGKKFFNAINKKLEDVRNDIVDAVQWTIDNKIADPKKIAIFGGSFGGYSVLAGLAFTPDIFSCGVDVVGPSNFITLLSSVPEYWKPSMVSWYKTAGNPDNPNDVPYLKSISPLFKKDDIKKPLLVFQGANDPRVAKKESDQIVAALKNNNHPVAYVVYPDEGHGFHQEANIKTYLAFTEIFLARFLGGWFEPFNEKVKSSYQIIEGEDLLK